MQIEFTPTQYLAYTLSLIESPYQPYFRGLALWDIALDEEEAHIKTFILNTPELLYILELTHGASGKDAEKEALLHENYLKKIVKNYGYSYNCFKTILYFVLGYDLDTGTYPRERTQQLKATLKEIPVFLDTLVEAEHLKSLKGFDSNSLTVLKNLINDETTDLQQLKKVISFYYFIEKLSQRDYNTHQESYKHNLKLVEQFNPSICLDYLRNLCNAIIEKEEGTSYDIHTVLICLDITGLQQLFYDLDTERVFGRLLSGNADTTKLLIELLLFVSALSSLTKTTI